MSGAPAGGAATSRLTRGRLALLATVGALGSMAIHMYVPAMPLVAAEFGAEPALVQLGVTLYLVSLALGQLASGPITDRAGRRPVLAAGSVLFVCGALGAALASDALVLLGARVVQAAGAAACLVAIRAIVTDLAEPGAAAARIAALTTFLLISPAVSPLLGGVLAGVGGWRTIFALLATVGAVAGLACWRAFGETRQAGPSARGAAASYRALLGDAAFLRYALALAAGSSAFHVLLSASPFVLIDRYGLTPTQAGVCFSLVAVASIAGTLVVRRVERSGRALQVGLACPAIAGALLLASAALGLDTVAILVVPMVVVGFGIGVAAPAAIAGAMRAVVGLAGTAASLLGALQMGTSGLTASLILQWHVDAPEWLGAGVLALGGLGLALVPRARPPS